MPKTNLSPRSLFAVSALAALLLACVVGPALQAAPKGRGKPATPSTPDLGNDPEAANDPAILGGPLFDLSGQAGLPKYLKCDQKALADPSGIRGGEVRTVDTDFVNKDFTLDLVFEFKGDDDKSSGFVGIGENAHDGGWLVNSVMVELNGPARGGSAVLRRHRSPDRPELGKYHSPGPHLLRVHKKDDNLTFAVFARFEGSKAPSGTAETKPDFARTVPNLKKNASFLNRLNSGLFFGGEVSFKSVRLEVDGAAVEPGPPANAIVGKTMGVDGPEHFVPFTIGSATPDYLSIPANAAIGADGLDLDNLTLRSKGSDYLTKDFTWDIVYHFKPGEKAIMVVGIGENGHDSGNWILNSVASRVHGPGHDGMATVTFHDFYNDPVFARLGPEHAGPNLFRVRKLGDTLTFAVCADYKGKFEPDFSATVPSLSTQAHYLTARNTSLFVYGGGTIEKMRLVVDGQDPGKGDVTSAGGARPGVGARPGPEASAGTGAAAAPAAPKPGPLVSMAGAAGLPDWLRGSAKTSADADGLLGGELRSVASDFLDKDFVMDVLFKFNHDQKDIRVGIGEDKGEWGEAQNSVAFKVSGGLGDGHCFINVNHRDAEIDMGKFGNSPGPHLLRITKAGNTLSFAVCPDYKPADPFNPTLVRSLPDLRSAAPFLSAKNGNLFIGGNSTWCAAGLSVNGKPADAGAARPAVVAAPPATGTPGTPSSPVRPANPAAPAGAGAGSTGTPGPLFKLAGGAGLPAWLRADAKTYADARGLRGGEWRTTASDLADHDFTFDLLFQFDGDDKEFRAGIGEDKGDWGAAENSVCARIGGPREDGNARITVNGRQAEIEFAKVGKSPGPHLLRIDKRGRALTFGLCPDYKGTYAPAFVRTLPDLKSAAPFLTAANSGLFVSGEATWLAAGLSLDGRPQGPAAASDPAPRDITGPEHLIPLAGARGLPDFLVPRRDLAFGKAGVDLDGKLIRTRAGDFLNKNFTFDVVFHFKADERNSFIVGIGDGQIDNYNVLHSVYARARGPQGGAGMVAAFDKSSNGDEREWGKFGPDHPGPHLLRLQKRGDALAMALCPDYRGAFRPADVHVIPALHSVAPYLTGRNSFLFIEGECGTIEQVRLVVEGEAVVSGDVALSVPPRVVEGQSVRQAMVKAPGGKRFSADPATAPKGLTISPAGELAWVPTRDQIGPHEFKVNIADKGQATVQTVEIDVVSREDAAAAGGDLTKIEGLYKLVLESENHRLAPGLGGTVLVLEGDQLRRLDANGVTVRQTLRLPHACDWIGERPDYFVALSDQTKSLDLIDKTKLTVIRSIQMDYLRRNDLCLNPARAVSYVTVDKAANDGIAHQILVVDEASGDVREPEDFVGTWVRASPDGRTLFAGYRDIYKKGERLLVNPDWIGTVPEYGHIDLLIVYDVSGRAPREVALKEEAGANGQGLAVSPDGRKVSYLSYVGYPLYSNNIAAWDPADLTKRPVAYPTKANKGDCKRLAFHPFLPVAAAPAEGGAVCFDRDGGQVQPDRLDFSLPLEPGVKVNDLVFSPDGRNLILDCEHAGERFLWRVRLKLSPAEEAVLRSPPKPAVPAAPAAPPPPIGKGQKV